MSVLCGNLGAPPKPPSTLSKRPASSPNARLRSAAVTAWLDGAISDSRAICPATSSAMRFTSSFFEA